MDIDGNEKGKGREMGKGGGKVEGREMEVERRLNRKKFKSGKKKYKSCQASQISLLTWHFHIHLADPFIQSEPLLGQNRTQLKNTDVQAAIFDTSSECQETAQLLQAEKETPHTFKAGTAGTEETPHL